MASFHFSFILINYILYKILCNISARTHHTHLEQWHLWTVLVATEYRQFLHKIKNVNAWDNTNHTIADYTWVRVDTKQWFRILLQQKPNHCSHGNAPKNYQKHFNKICKHVYNDKQNDIIQCKVATESFHCQLLIYPIVKYHKGVLVCH